jgi:hypothetical protein
VQSECLRATTLVVLKLRTWALGCRVTWCSSSCMCLWVLLWPAPSASIEEEDGALVITSVQILMAVVRTAGTRNK